MTAADESSAVWRQEAMDVVGDKMLAVLESRGYTIVPLAATPPAEGLDVERLKTVLETLWRQKWETEPGRGTVVIFGAYAEDIAREYAALAPEQPE